MWDPEVSRVPEERRVTWDPWASRERSDRPGQEDLLETSAGRVTEESRVSQALVPGVPQAVPDFREKRDFLDHPENMAAQENQEDQDFQERREIWESQDSTDYQERQD